MEAQAKTEIVWVSPQVGYLPQRVHAGVLRQGERCLLVDTGLDRSAGNRIAAAVQAAGLQAKGLLITHCHADHNGGNAALHGKLGVAAHVPAAEAFVLRYPEYMPRLLYGAAPPAALLVRFFLAQTSPEVVELSPGPQQVGGVPFTAVPLPGHSPSQFGYLSEDGVLSIMRP